MFFSLMHKKVLARKILTNTKSCRTHKFRSAMQISALLSDFLFLLKNRNVKIILPKIKNEKTLEIIYLN